MLNIADSAATYPLLTLVPQNAAPAAISVPGPPAKTVRLHFEPDDSAAEEEALLRAEKGEQVLWIENTVSMAQEKFKKLASRAQGMNLECGLLHSRFTPHDREKNERYWTGIFGKSSLSRSRCGRLLVGTQVLEQSLDLDADFLVTRLCPTDMLLQRMGRLWRHERGDRAKSSIRETWILAPGFDSVLENPAAALRDSGTSSIYAPYILARTLEVWRSLDKVVLPEDIRSLLENTYSARAEEPTAKMLEARNALGDECEKKRNLALSGVAKAGRIMDDDEPGTRLIEEKEAKLLLLRDFDFEKGTCVCLDGSECVLKPVPQNREERQDLARTLAMNILKAPQKSAPEKLRCEYLEAFAPYIFEARVWKEGNSVFGGDLRIAIVKEGQKLGDIFGNNLPDIHYSDTLGYYRKNKF